MSIAIHAMRRGSLAPADEALIIGAGGIGTFLTLAASSEQADLTVVDLQDDRLEIASHLGADRTVLVDSDSSLIEALGGPGSFDVVYECTGVPHPLQAALDLVRPGGRVVAVGIPKGEISINVNRLVLQEKDLVGTLAHAFSSDFPAAIDLLHGSAELMKRVAPDVLPLETLVTEGIEPIVERRQTRIKALFSPKVDEPRAIIV
jgi:(R,R)-butanediol dehydrogenase/meso-butanediol dehydrogenase/diacetyl reductase